MRNLVIIPLLFAFASCSSFSWQGQSGRELSDQQKDAGIRDVRSLEDEFEATTYWAGVRRRSDGRRNAFARGLSNIGATFSRHFMNYSPLDPEVNYRSNTGYLTHTGRFLTSWIGDIMPR